MNPEKKKNGKGGARLFKGSSAEGSKREKKAKPVRTRRQQILHVLFIVATVIAAIIVAAAVIYKLLVVKPQLPNHGEVENGPEDSQETLVPNGPKVTGDRKDEFYTFLLVGRDTGGGGNTDTIMVVAYDVANQNLSVMSIPRDTMVNVPWDLKRINSVYNYAPYYDKEGMEFLKEEVAYLIGFEPDYTIMVEWEAVGELVDAVGPIYFDVPLDMNYEDPTQDLYIHLQAGYQPIDGDKAMQLLRWRKNNKMVNGQNVIYGGYPTGDLGRIETQQAFLSAVVEQCLKNITDLKTITSLVRIFMDNVTTSDNLTINNLAWFAQEAILGGLTMEHVNFMTMPNQGVYVYSRTYKDNQSYVVPIPDEMLEMVNTYFNPYLEDIQLNELDLMSVNADGSLSSTRGVVEDTKAAQPPSTPKPVTTPEPVESAQPSPEETPVQSPEVPAQPSPETSAEPENSQSPPPAVIQTPQPTPAVTESPTPSPTPTPGIEYGPGMVPVE